MKKESIFDMAYHPRSELLSRGKSDLIRLFSAVIRGKGPWVSNLEFYIKGDRDVSI
jgi:hypothetical protein